MYRTIAQHPPRARSTKRLVMTGASEEDPSPLRASERRRGARGSGQLQDEQSRLAGGAWSGLTRAPEQYERGTTAVPLGADVGLAMTAVPESCTCTASWRSSAAPQASRAAPTSTGDRDIWRSRCSIPRCLAPGLGRGAYSQRHANSHRTTEERIPCPLHRRHRSRWSTVPVRGGCRVRRLLPRDPNSLFSGARFGDFANGAGLLRPVHLVWRSKWHVRAGLLFRVRGRGPDRSAPGTPAAAAEDNIQVLYPSTPASYFHAPPETTVDRKPLIDTPSAAAARRAFEQGR
jgi:2-oxoglutarate dehydrogenase E1 component